MPTQLPFLLAANTRLFLGGTAAVGIETFLRCCALICF